MANDDNNEEYTEPTRKQRKFWPVFWANLDFIVKHKEKTRLSRLLNDDESVLEVLDGSFMGDTELMALTDHRIMFIRRGLIYGGDLMEIPTTMINEAATHSGFVIAELTITNGAKSVSIVTVHKRQAEVMASAINEVVAKLHRVRNAEPQAQAATAPGLADQLAKLVEMRDNGTLSYIEFEAAKAKLLE